MMVEDGWVQAAITDDNVVVELLVRLKQAQAAPSAPKSALPALKWGMRQRRSRPVLFRFEAKRDGDFNASARGSPTTPLCWSGGSSGSDASPSAADGFEETSAHVLRSPPRSKGGASSETHRASTKRLRRKKTFAELKEEENILLKERDHLKKEIASTRATREEHKATNDNLKSIRVSWSSNEPDPRAPSSSASSLHDDRKPLIDSHNVGKATSGEKSIFVLPDLNMMPAEDDSSPEILYGTS